jgi:hypothetical protein
MLKAMVERDAAASADVEAYAGHRGDEWPRRFRLGGRTVEVAATLSTWRTPEVRGFEVRGHDGRRYALACREDGWSVEPRPPGRT